MTELITWRQYTNDHKGPSKYTLLPDDSLHIIMTSSHTFHTLYSTYRFTLDSSAVHISFTFFTYLIEAHKNEGIMLLSEVINNGK